MTEMLRQPNCRSRTQLNGWGESASPPQCQFPPHHSSERHIESLCRDPHSASKRKLAHRALFVREAKQALRAQTDGGDHWPHLRFGICMQADAIISVPALLA